MSKVLTGARAILSITAADGTVEDIGMFSSCSYGANIGLEPIHILGRFGPAEITQTSYEAINVSCNGFRVIGKGVHKLGKFPTLDQLLLLEGITISIRDRQNNSSIMVVSDCKPQSYSTGVNAKATSQISITYVGLKLADETGNQNEVGATNLP